MQSYPYRLAGDSVKTKVSETLQVLLEAWAKEWFVSPPPCNIRIADAIPADREWLAHVEDADRWTACTLKERAQRDFMHLLFGPTTGNAPSAVIAETLHACMDDLLQRLMPRKASALPISNDSLAGLRTGAGSGVLYASFDGSLPVQGLALGGAWVESVAAGALPVSAKVAALTPRRTLIGKGRTRLELSLGEAELPLSELAGIALGDVLTLDASYLDPLQLRTVDGQNLCKAHLGRVGQHKAIQIINK